jgi:hypothetical protein
VTVQYIWGFLALAVIGGLALTGRLCDTPEGTHHRRPTPQRRMSHRHYPLVWVRYDAPAIARTWLGPWAARTGPTWDRLLGLHTLHQPEIPPGATTIHADAGPHIDAVTVVQRAAQYRQALTPEQRWPHLQRSWSTDTGEFPAFIAAMEA